MKKREKNLTSIIWDDKYSWCDHHWKKTYQIEKDCEGVMVICPKCKKSTII